MDETHIIKTDLLKEFNLPAQQARFRVGKEDL